MKRALALSALLLALLSARPASADILVVYNDSLVTYGTSGSAQKNLAHFWDLLKRSVKPGVRINMTSSDGWNLVDFRDNVSPTASTARYKASLMIMVQADRNAVISNSGQSGKDGRIAMTQVTKAANRPQVPVLFVNVSDDASFQSGGNDSVGVTGGQVTLTTPFAYSPAGYQFPTQVTGWVKGAGGAYPAMGDYVTPVLSLGMHTYTKADPDGQGGWNSHPGTQSDTLFAWFYNPPDNSTLSNRTTTGFGAIQFGAAGANAGGAQFSEGSLAVVAVGMAARLAPDQFKFPAVNVALDVDDGCKRFSSASSLPQVLDALAGIDSLNYAGIPYTVGIETDSMVTVESNGNTRFQNEMAVYRRNKLGRVTVHNHAGLTAGGAIADTSLASVSGGVYTDILGVAAARWCFGTTAGQRNQSVYGLLNGATRKLIDAAGDARIVSSCVMAPTDNYKTNLAGTSGGNAANYDSIGYAISLAAMGYQGFPGYTVVRTQYLATTYNYQQGGGTGGFPRGYLWSLPAMATIGAAVSPAVTNVSRFSLLYAPSGYIYGNTADTTTAQDAGAMKVGMNARLARSMGFNRLYDMTTAQEAANASALSFHGTTKETIWVTHLPNWRQGIGITTPTFGGGRPGWENVRLVHGAMEAAKWAAQQANTASTTYFSSGPVKWVWADQITARDTR